MAGNPLPNTNSDPHQIVHRYQLPNAPTGEGEIYVTRDGTHWRRVRRDELSSTHALNVHYECDGRIQPGNC